MPFDVTESDQATTELGQAGAMLFAELEEAHAAKAAAEARIERARQAIELLAGDAQEIHVGGQLVATWRPQVSRRFDQATAKRFLTAEQADACMVEVESRPFRRTS
jgi:multidrug resistance efflux pump